MGNEIEYSEVNTNLRYYGNMRFAQLTIFFALTSGLMSIFFKNELELKPIIKFCIEVAGILLSVLFWIMEESATKKWITFKTKATELEKELGFTQLTNSPVIGLFSATNATRIIFICVIIFWLIIIYTYSICLSRCRCSAETTRRGWCFPPPTT